MKSSTTLYLHNSVYLVCAVTIYCFCHYSSWVIQLLIWAQSPFFCIWNYDETQSQCFWVNMMMGDTWPCMIWGWLFQFTLWSWEQKGSLLTGIVLLETSVEVSQELSFLCTISFHVIAFLFFIWKGAWWTLWMYLTVNFLNGLKSSD